MLDKMNIQNLLLICFLRRGDGDGSHPLTMAEHRPWAYALVCGSTAICSSGMRWRRVEPNRTVGVRTTGSRSRLANSV